jgi:cob(I)alamin adenosyltransferase
MSIQKFYTATGDDGETGLLGEGRVPKDHPRLEAVGAIDEAGAFLGLARAHARAPQTAVFLKEVQRHLYRLMAEVAATPENAAQFRRIGGDQVAWLEARIAEIGEAVPPPKEFILPGDSPGGAYLDAARTVVRRAERRLAALIRSGEVENRDLLRYLNRLSSLCFALELLENYAAGVTTSKAKED